MREYVGCVRLYRPSRVESYREPWAMDLRLPFGWRFYLSQRVASRIPVVHLVRDDWTV